MAKQDNFYDEDLDQPIADPRNPDNDDAKDENEYQTFLAPKNAFPEASREVGAVHRVKTVRALESELELQCVHKGGSDDEKENDSEGLYE